MQKKNDRWWEDENLSALVSEFIHKNIKILSDCFEDAYSSEINELDEFEEGYSIRVKKFIGEIVEDVISFEIFKSSEILMGTILKTDLRTYSVDDFLMMLMLILDDKDFFSRLLLKKALSEQFPECKIIEEKASESFPFDTICLER